MSDRSQVLNCLYAAVDELNEQRPADDQLANAEDTAVAGANASLDSLGFLNLIMGIEAKLADEFGTSVSVAEQLMSGADITPPETLGALADLVTQLQEA